MNMCYNIIMGNFIGWKVGLSKEDSANGISKKQEVEIVSEVLQEEIKSKNKYTKISKNMVEGPAF